MRQAWLAAIASRRRRVGPRRRPCQPLCGREDADRRLHLDVRADAIGSVMRLLALVLALAAQAAPRSFEVASIKPHEPRQSARHDGGRRVGTLHRRRHHGGHADPNHLRPAGRSGRRRPTAALGAVRHPAKAADATPPTAMGHHAAAGCWPTAFRMTSHRETRELPVTAGEGAQRWPARAAPRSQRLRVGHHQASGAGEAGRAACGGISEGFGRMSLNAMPIPVFLQYLAPKVNRVIVDRTSLTGNFDIELRWTPDNLPPVPRALPADQPIRVNGERCRSQRPVALHGDAGAARAEAR